MCAQVAAEALGQLGQPDPEVVAALVTALRDEDATVCCNAAASLGHLGASSPEVVTILIDLLTRTEGFSLIAPETLGQLGQTSSEVVAALLASLGDKDVTERYADAEALGQLWQLDPEVVAKLKTALMDLSRDKNVASLTQLGESNPEAVTILSDLLGYIEGRSRIYAKAATVLGQIATSDDKVIRGLMRGLFDSDWDTRNACAQALTRIGQRFPGATQALQAQLFQLLLELKDSRLDQLDNSMKHAVQNCVFDALWLLTASGRS